MTDAKTYVETHLRREMEAFQRLGIGREVTQLSDYEKVLIFYYTGEGYRALNRALRAGQFHPMEQLLNEALDKLPDEKKRMVFRGTSLSELVKENYRKVAQEKSQFVELAFFSTSKSKSTAFSFSGNDTLIEISSLHGKSIEALSYFGESHSRNEEEVLFKSKSVFKVVGFRQIAGRTIIKLKEIEP